MKINKLKINKLKINKYIVKVCLCYGDIDKVFLFPKVNKILAELGINKKPIKYKNGYIYFDYDEKNLEYFIYKNLKIYYYNKIEDYIVPDLNLRKQ